MSKLSKSSVKLCRIKKKISTKRFGAASSVNTGKEHTQYYIDAPAYLDKLGRNNDGAYYIFEYFVHNNTVANTRIV